jgi:hypothetical protein
LTGTDAGSGALGGDIIVLAAPKKDVHARIFGVRVPNFRCVRFKVRDRLRGTEPRATDLPRV